MERVDGYYWTQMSYMGVWVIGLYREVNGHGLWFLPGLATPLESNQFKYIADQRLSHPSEMNGVSRIWVPDQIV